MDEQEREESLIFYLYNFFWRLPKTCRECPLLFSSIFHELLNLLNIWNLNFRQMWHFIKWKTYVSLNSINNWLSGNKSNKVTFLCKDISKKVGENIANCTSRLAIKHDKTRFQKTAAFCQILGVSLTGYVEDIFIEI